MICEFSGYNDFLSNFYPVTLVDKDYEDIIYPTVEHAFQAAKTNNKIERIMISNAESPSLAKKLGRRVTLVDDWEQIKDGIMLYYVTEKFKNKELMAKLLGTGDQILVEGTKWHDNYWGSCSCKKCGDKGANHLGLILMTVRGNIKKLS